MRVAMFAAVVMALAGPAAAQDWTAGTEEGWSGAVACSAGDAACLSVGCTKGSTLLWEMWFAEGLAGGVTVPGAVTAEIAVDGAVTGFLSFAFDAGPGLWTAPVNGDGEAVILPALQSGTRATVSLSFDTTTVPYDIGLIGSRAAIDAALLACPARSPLVIELPQEPVAAAVPGKPAAAPFPDPFPNSASGALSDNPAAAVLDQVSADCGGPGNVVINAGFVRLGDLDADGINDAIIDLGAAGCTDLASLYCGTGGCTMEIWLGAADGMFRHIFSGLVQSLDPAGPGRIDIVFDGGACGLSGAESCAAAMRIEGGALVRAD